MKSKAILVFLMAVFAVTAAITFASANASDLNVDIGTTVSGVDLCTYCGNTFPHVSLETGDTVPVRVQVTASEDITDAVVKVSLSGEDVEAQTEKFDMISGRTYSKLLSLKMPSDLKVSPSDEFTLVVEVEARQGQKEARYDFTVQRASYNLEILSVDSTSTVAAGSNLAVDVVLKNSGSHRLDDTFVTVRIPALDVEKKVYFGDLVSNDGSDYNLVVNGQSLVVHQSSSKEDSAEGTLFLQIPSDAKAGTYTLEVEASDSDATVSTTKSVSISGTEQKTDVMAAATSKDVSAGETVTYDLVLINSGDKIAVYQVVPETAQNLVVSVDQPIVTVPAGSSTVVKVNAQAGQVMGTFNFAVDVNSNDKLVKTVNFTANVGKKTVVGNNVIVLTVVLAIIFVVLLIVLVVLLTRKPEKTEEFGENYY